MKITFFQPIGAKSLSQQVIVFEVIAFTLVIAVIWLNELLDIPHFLLMAPATPTNWSEAVLESTLIIPLSVALVRYTRRLFQRLRYLEGLLPICSSCKRIRDEHGDWQVIEAYIGRHSDAKFSHGLCPVCARTLYPDVFPKSLLSENLQD